MDKFKESTVLTTYFPALDGFRFFAVSFVMFSHWFLYSQLENLNIFLGFAGVNMFFTLSGFLISRILLVQKTVYQQQGLSLFKSFYIRRALRIFPLYYAVLLAGLLLTIPSAREAVVRLATFTLNIPFSTLEFQPAENYNHFWSLSAEEQFYFVFPFLFILIPAKFLRHLFWGMVIVGLLSRVYIYLNFPGISMYNKKWVAYIFTPCCFDSFGIGALLAWYYCNKPVILSRIVSRKKVVISAFILFILLAAWSIISPYGPVPNIFLRLSFSICCAWLIGAIVLNKLPKKVLGFFTQSFIVYLGKISYGIYVFHLIVPWVVKKLGWQYNDFHFAIPVYTILYAVITVMLATLSWKFFENPVNKLKDRFPYFKKRV